MKNLLTKIDLKESKQHCHQLFFAKKATDWIYIMFYPQMTIFSEQNFINETFLRSFLAVSLHSKTKSSRKNM